MIIVQLLLIETNECYNQYLAVLENNNGQSRISHMTVQKIMHFCTYYTNGI